MKFITHFSEVALEIGLVILLLPKGFLKIVLVIVKLPRVYVTLLVLELFLAPIQKWGYELTLLKKLKYDANAILHPHFGISS
jgi:hypothetical protein